MKALVDPFYESQGGGTRARPDDLFFLAFAGVQLVGAVRFCVEEGHPMLRGMMIREEFRGQGVGREMLDSFAAYLDQKKIREVFCLPYDYLVKFYSSAGFRAADPAKVPKFLSVRMGEYNLKPKKVICMMRP